MFVSKRLLSISTVHFSLHALDSFKGQTVPLNILHNKTHSLWNVREKGSHYLLFHNMVNQGTVWGRANSQLMACLQFPTRNWFLELPLFSAKDLLQCCYTEKQLDTQVVFNFRQIGSGKIIILSNKETLVMCMCLTSFLRHLNFWLCYKKPNNVHQEEISLNESLFVASYFSPNTLAQITELGQL